jgi:hypothetical protein
MLLKSPAPLFQSRRLGARVTLGACGLAAIVAAGLFSVNSDAVVAGGFEQALASLRTAPAKVVPARGYDGVSGSEEFWLTASLPQGAFETVAVGRQIMLDSNGAKRRFTVTEVEDVSGDVTRIDVGAEPNRVLAVTCVDGESETGGEVQVRFLLESRTLAATGPQRAL